MSTKKIVSLVAIALIAVVIIVANVFLAGFTDTITMYLQGAGIDWDNQKLQAALLESEELAEEIAGEGIVVLKNDNDALPFAESENKINIFGWGATGYASSESSLNYSGGFVLSGSGSGNADVSKAKRLLNAFEDEGIEYNQELIDISKNYKNGRAGTASLSNHSHLFFRLYEAPVSDYDAEVMQNALNHSDVAMIVISRLGGEGKDLPTVQYKAARANPGNGDTSADLVTDPSRTYVEISTEEEALIDHVTSAGFKKVILLLNTCNIMELGFIDEYPIDAVISVGALGTSGALAIPRVLKGKKMVSVIDDETGLPKKDGDGRIIKEEINFSPSGKTVDTWPYSQKSDPAYINSGQNYYQGHDSSAHVVTPTGGGHTGVMAYAGGSGANNNGTGGNYIDYQEGIYLGYKYYETAAAEEVIDYDEVVQFPFGFGLSYTSFEWKVKDITLSGGGTTLTARSKVTAEIWVTNTGSYPGQDVVQVYVTTPYIDGKIEKPHVQLVAYSKTEILQPEDTQLLTLTFDAYDFASYDCYDLNGNGFAGYELDAGKYLVKIQTDSHNIADCDSATTEFNVPVAGIKFNEEIEVTEDGVTKVLSPAQNYFTGIDADGGVPLDGKAGNTAIGVNGGAGITFLSRSDFNGTFPNAATKKPSRTVSHGLQEGYGQNDAVTVDPPMGTGAGTGNLRISYAENDSEAVKEQVRNTLLTLGADYNDPLWGDLLDQMSAQEMYRLVQNGGYKTAAVASIGKPRVWNFDGPSGLNINNQSLRQSFWTAFPVETVVGQTWSAKLAYYMGLAVGAEAAQSNVAGWYAPGVNLHRSAFAGRNFEYFSEDAVLSGIMGAEVTNGALQNGLYCYVKHFAVNDLETHRGHLKTWLTEQALREIYLKPFEICVKRGKASGIMSSFNYIGAIWTGGSKPLCTNILREEWGFQGSVVTDYANGLSSGHMNSSQGLRAGNDLWLTGVDGGGNNVDATGSELYLTASDKLAGSYNYSEDGTLLLRNACHNILFSHCNAYWYANTHENNTGRFAADVGELKEAAEEFPYWWLGVAAIDLVVLIGLGVWAYFLFFKKPKKT